MTSRLRFRKVLMGVINAVGLCAAASLSHAADSVTSSSVNSNTNTCTINGVRYIDCDITKPAPVPDYSLCPERRFDFDYGKACDFRSKTLHFRALKLQHDYGGQGFKAGTPLVAAYDMSDNGTVVGEAYNDRGIRHAVSVEVGPLYSASNLYFSDLGKASLTSSARAIGYNNIIAGSEQSSPRGKSTNGYAWNIQGSQGKAIGLNGNAGVATGVGVSMYQRAFVSGYDRWPVAEGGDGKVHGFLWIYHGPGYEWLSPLGAKGQISRALDVNDSGRAVGYLTQRGINQAFLAMNENLEALPDFGNYESQALDVNNNAIPKIVGFAKDRTGARHPVMWQSQKINVLRQLPNKKSGTANAISDAGDIVGESGGRATVWRDGTVQDLNKLLDTPIRATLQSAVDINRHGRILVKASDGYYVLMPTSNE